MSHLIIGMISQNMISTNAKTSVKYLHLINRIHNRVMTYLRKLLEGNQCDGLPKDNVYINIREYQ